MVLDVHFFSILRTVCYSLVIFNSNSFYRYISKVFCLHPLMEVSIKVRSQTPGQTPLSTGE